MGDHRLAWAARGRCRHRRRRSRKGCSEHRSWVHMKSRKYPAHSVRWTGSYVYGLEAFIESSQIVRRATPIPRSRLGRQKECKGMPLISFEWESRGGTCKKRIRNQGGQCPWAVVPNPAEDTLKNRRASIQSVKIVKLTRKTIQRTHLLGALLLGEHLFFLRDNLRLVFQTECEGKANQQRGRRHDPNDVSENFSTLLDERRGRGDF